MRVTITGTVVSRSRYTAKDGSERYQIVIEEPGQFPSRFLVSSRLASAFGPSDGFAAVGRTVTADAFCNGAERERPRTDGSGTFKIYPVWFSLISLAPVGGTTATAPAAQSGDDDIESCI